MEFQSLLHALYWCKISKENSSTLTKGSSLFEMWAECQHSIVSKATDGDKDWKSINAKVGHF